MPTPYSRLFDWTPGPAPATVLAIADTDDYEPLREYYAPYGKNPPLERVFSLAVEHQVRSIVIEHRYIDLDYRDEHAHFYSTTFRRYPSVCHRLHFFSDVVDPDWANLDRLQDAYCGYAVIRPLERSPVGRTMIKPPPVLLGSQAVAATSEDRINLLGTEFRVEAAPFISQDAQYLVCAHASLWMIMYQAYLKHGQPRRLPSDIHEACTGGVVTGRQLPSEGLSVHQMLVGLDALDMPAQRLGLPETREASRAAGGRSLMAIVCRHINSGMPCIVVSDGHAWVVVGYRNAGSGPAHDNLVLYRNDDAAGPYVEVNDPWNEQYETHRPWDTAIPPMPRKVYLPGERAEPLATRWLTEAAIFEGAQPYLDALSGQYLTFLTYAIRSNDFKLGTRGRGLGDQISALYRYAQLPRYLWVIEAVDRRLRDGGEPCVIGEALIDATAPTEDKGDALLGVHVGGKARLHLPDFDVHWTADWPDFAPYSSGCPLVRF